MEATASVSNLFREKLRLNRRHVCVRLVTSADQVPEGLVVRPEGTSSEALADINLSNLSLVQATCDEAAAYRVSLMAYAEHGARGLRALNGLVAMIHSCSKGRALILLDAIGWQAGTEGIWSPEQVFEQARLLGVEAVVVSPCGGRDKLETCLELAAAKDGMAGMELFVYCHGCLKQNAPCFDRRVADFRSTSIDEKVGYAIGDRWESHASMVLTTGRYPIPACTRAVAGIEITLLVPWPKGEKDEETEAEASLQGALVYGRSKLLVEVLPSDFLQEPGLLSRINALSTGWTCPSFA